jgi:hypothetical protein
MFGRAGSAELRTSARSAERPVGANKPIPIVAHTKMTAMRCSDIDRPHATATPPALTLAGCGVAR